MAPDSGEADAAALRDRVADLEQTVADQQATIDSLAAPTASRRGVLAALTGVAGAGALGAYSQRGAAQAAGQVGTQSEPVDVEAYDLNVQNQLAGDLDVGGNSLTNAGAVSADETVAGRLNADQNLAVRGRPSEISISQPLTWYDIPSANIQDNLGLSPDGGDTFTLSEFRTCLAFGKVRIDGLNTDDQVRVRLTQSHDGGPILAQSRKVKPQRGSILYLPIISTQTLEDHNTKWQVRNEESGTGTIKTGNQNTNLSVIETPVGGFNKPTR